MTMLIIFSKRLPRFFSENARECEMRKKRELSYKTSISIIIIALFGLFSTQATAASFDCHKAASWVEKTVCSNPELSKLDAEMAKAYHDALASLSSEGQKETKQYQKQWLKEISYIKDKYDKYYAENKEHARYHDKRIVQSLRDDYEKRIEELQKILIKFPPRIFRHVYVSNAKTNKDCEYLVERRTLSYPQIENPRDENEKFWNTLIYKKVRTDFEKRSKGNACTDILHEYGVSFSNKQLISFHGSQYHYSHGHAHGYDDASISFSWLLKDKRELKATDLFDDITGLSKKLSVLIAKKQKEWETDSNATLIAPDMDALFSPNMWLISKEGLDFRLMTYNFANNILITIDWKDIEPYLSKNGHSSLIEYIKIEKVIFDVNKEIKYGNTTKN
jgi:uncharacterized protein YecT (DUF1311 family)